MNNAQVLVSEHNYSFDFMRTFTILAVILFHAAGAYGIMGAKYWPVVDMQNFLGSAIRELFDVFIMPFFMFIAGYFALPSIRNRSFIGFFISKFKRLYLYWIFLFLFILPIGKYFALKYDHNNVSYITYLLNSFQNIVNVSNDPVSIGTNGHMHFWFISLLFYVLILFGIIYKSCSKLLSEINILKNTSYKEINIFNILIFGFITTLFYFIIILVFPGSYWILIPKILQFKTTHLPVLISFFCFGVYASYRGWFDKQGVPFNLNFWIFVSLLLTILFFITGQDFFTKIDISNTLSPLYLFVFSLIRSFLILSYMMLALLLANRYFSAKNKYIEKVSDVSYEIYLVHLMLVVTFQVIFQHFNFIPVTVKIIAVFILGTITSYFFAKYTIYKFPKIIAVIFILGFVLMTILYR